MALDAGVEQLVLARIACHRLGLLGGAPKRLRASSMPITAAGGALTMRIVKVRRVLATTTNARTGRGAGEVR